MIQDDPELWIIVSNSLDLRTFSTTSAIRDRLAMSEFLLLYPQDATFRRRCRLFSVFGLLIPQLQTYRQSGDLVAIYPERSLTEAGLRPRR